MSALERAFDSFFAFDFKPLDTASALTSRYHWLSDEVDAQIKQIVAPLKQYASKAMRPHSIRWSSGHDFSAGVDPMPALCGHITPSAMPYIRAKGFYGNWPYIQFTCLVKTPDEFTAFWRAMRATADTLAASEIFEPQPTDT